MSWTNEHVAILLEEYEKYPALYTVKHPQYYSRHWRNIYLEKIASKLASTRPNTTTSDIHKKFTGLRNTYAAERKKYVDSLKSGAGDDNVYKPALWYYDKMQYLNSHLGIRKSKSNMYTDTVSAQAHSEEGPELLEMSSVSEPWEGEIDISETKLIFSPDAHDGTLSFVDCGHSSSVTPPPVSRKRPLIRETDVLDSSNAKCLKDTSSTMQAISTTKANSVEPNDDAIYVAYVQSRLGCITDKMRKIRVKHAIDNLLYDAIEQEATDN